jgi:hypothetical protein
VEEESKLVGEVLSALAESEGHYAVVLVGSYWKVGADVFNAAYDADWKLVSVSSNASWVLTFERRYVVR